MPSKDGRNKQLYKWMPLLIDEDKWRRDFRLPPRSRWELRSAGLLHLSSGNFLPCILDPWRWDR